MPHALARTCEQVILMCSFSSHSFRKSIITCASTQQLSRAREANPGLFHQHGARRAAELTGSHPVIGLVPPSSHVKGLQMSAMCDASAAWDTSGSEAITVRQPRTPRNQLTHLGLVVNSEHDLHHSRILQSLCKHATSLIRYPRMTSVAHLWTGQVMQCSPSAPRSDG